MLPRDPPQSSASRLRRDPASGSRENRAGARGDGRRAATYSPIGRRDAARILKEFTISAESRGESDEYVTDEYLRNNAEYAKRFHGHLPLRPKRHTAVVACMDSRLDLFAILGLDSGDAHLIRNAGGVVTDDVLRSLVISQRLMGTNEIILMHHTNCGMVTFTDEELRAKIAAETGSAPAYPFHSFTDIDDDVRAGLRRIRNDPHLPNRRVRGFTFDIDTGLLTEIHAD